MGGRGKRGDLRGGLRDAAFGVCDEVGQARWAGGDRERSRNSGVSTLRSGERDGAGDHHDRYTGG
ncbi:hypothetical protein SD72_10915 [Leucobacter komagatae]|uniref:Uncharacterized protein n=1 Tax=Leucobacter komagatae TaxID=55969 RepID=A0A0D0HX27_9MICO|nr:hypothetical protein SD72_10915 [Leucobacter komagatae]